MLRLLLAGAEGYAAYRAGRKYFRGQPGAGRMSYQRDGFAGDVERSSTEETSAAARKLRSRAPVQRTASNAVADEFMGSASPVATAAAVEGMSTGDGGGGAHTQEPAEGSRGVIERELKRAGRITGSSSGRNDGEHNPVTGGLP